MPFTLRPLYIHGENVMVLGISPSSPLSGYISRGDFILSVDGDKIRSPHQLIEKIVHVDPMFLRGINSNRKGYCVPSNWLEESKAVLVLDDNFSCPNDYTAFNGFQCLNSNPSSEINFRHHDNYKKEIKRCLSPQQVVKLSKCGEGWGGTGSRTNLCSCSEEEYCMAPFLSPGVSWLEISYSNPYSSECLQQKRNASSADLSLDHSSYPCGVGTFVYVGDKLMLANSIRLSAYQPRSILFSWIMDVPTTLENILSCTYHVSAALAVLNSLPVFFLDGEYILESAFCYIAWFTPKKRRRAAQVCLTVGTILSAIAFSRVIYFAFHSVTKS